MGQTAYGPCVNQKCPSGYTCIGVPPNSVCCGFPASSDEVTCPLIDSVGPCISGNCPSGYLCDTVNPDAEKLCCPNFVEPLAAIGPCENTIPRCPQGKQKPSFVITYNFAMKNTESQFSKAKLKKRFNEILTKKDYLLVRLTLGVFSLES